MNNAENQAKNLKNYIEKIANKILANKVVSGVTTGVVKAIDGKEYIITLSGSNEEVVATSIDKSQTYAIDNSVYLVYYTDGTYPVYLIYDTVSDTYETYFNLTLDERFDDENGENIFQDFVTDSEGLNTIITDLRYIEKIKDSGCFKIEGKFGTNSETSNDFGLQIDFYSNEEDQNPFKTEYLNIDYFLGQPHNLSTSVVQSRIITLLEEDKNKLQSIGIKTFGTGFSYDSIKLTCGILLNIESTFVATLNIENEKNYFSPDEYKDSITLIAEVTQDGRPLKSSSLSYYWLLKDDKFNDINSDQYLAVAGDGWRCINKSNLMYKPDPAAEGLVQVRLWEKNQPKITITEDEIQENPNLFPDFHNVIKCLITYRDVVVTSREVDIYNYYKESFSARLDASVNPAMILSKDDSFTLSCSINNDNSKININNYKYEYTWYSRLLINEKNILKNIKILYYIYTDDNTGALKKYYATETEPAKIKNFTNIGFNEKEGYYYLIDTCEEDGNMETWIYQGEEVYNEIKYESWEKISSDYSGTKILIEPILPLLQYQNITPKNYNGNILKIVDKSSEEEAGSNTYIYKMQSASEEIFCEVEIKTKDRVYISTEQTNYVQISSALQDINIDINSEKEFKYYISTNNKSVTFDQLFDATTDNQEGTESVWNGDWSINDNNLEGLIWTSLTEFDSENKAYLKLTGENFEIFDGITGDPNNIYYVYYTERTVWSNQNIIIRKENWVYPTLIRAVIYADDDNWKNLKTGQAIEQINTYNQLTNYGKEQGIFYTDDAYIVTSDKKVNTSKQYYTKTIENDGRVKYSQFTGNAFAENTTYYEKSDKKLYINADYINTGTFRVGDSTKEKFYASINSDKVKIGGYIVDETTLTSGDVGMSSNRGSYAFWAGNKDANLADFSVTHGGSLISKSGNIGGWIIGPNYLHSGSGTSYVGISSGGSDYAFWAGDSDADFASFSVTHTGDLKSISGEIGGWKIKSNYLISPDENVKLFSSNAETGCAISAGLNEAPEFSISNTNEIEVFYKIQIDGEDFYEGNNAKNDLPIHNFGYDNSVNNLYLSNTSDEDGNIDTYYYQGRKEYNGVLYDYWVKNEIDYSCGCYTNLIVKSSSSFRLYNDGSLYASNAYIEGTINATEGNIGGWNIQKNYLSNGGLTLYSSSSEYSITSETIIEKPSESFDPGFPIGKQYYSFSISKAGDLIALGNAQINEWHFQTHLKMKKPSENNNNSVGENDPFYSSGINSLKSGSMYMGSVIMPSTDIDGNNENIILSKDRLYGIHMEGDSYGNRYTDIITMSWWELLKAAHRSIGIKTGYCIFKKSADGEWRYIEIFQSKARYNIVATARPRTTALKSATIMTTWHYIIDGSNKYTYYVGRRGSNTSDYEVEVNWIAIPSISSIDFDSTNFNIYSEPIADDGEVLG